MPFTVVCVTIVVGALTSVLLLNTAMARGSYESVQMRRDIAQLHQDRAALLTQLESASAPGGLAAAAQELGMVPAGRMGFVSLAQGAVLEASAG